MSYIEDLTKIHRFRAQVRRVNDPEKRQSHWVERWRYPGNHGLLFYNYVANMLAYQSEPVIGPTNPLVTAVRLYKQWIGNDLNVIFS